MTSARARIAIVAPDLSQIQLISGIVALSRQFDISVFSFNTPAVSRCRWHNVPLYLFDMLPDMPGYMRGLEERLAAFDAVIGLETYQLSSFQAMRAATRYKKPFATISSTTKPFAFVEYPNIHAIQADLLARSDFFWPTSKKAMEVLTLDGISETKMQVAFPNSNAAGQGRSLTLREKFRRYIKIPDQALVFLFHSDMDEAYRPENVIQAMILLAKAGHRKLGQMRILFVGDGHAAKDLRYRASDSKLGAQCLFLSQDPTPFLADLYCASDIIIVPGAKGESGIARSQLNVLDAMGYGVVPLVLSGSQEAEWVGSGGVVGDLTSVAGLAAEMARFSIMAPSALNELSANAIGRFTTHLSSSDKNDCWHNELSRLVTIGNQKGQALVGIATKLRLMSEQIEGGQSQEALIEIESEILTDSNGDRVRAELFCLKGDAHSQLGNFDDALASFQQALQTGQELQRAYRGLGFLSLKSHSHEESLTFFKRALAADPQDSQSMLGIGMIYRRLKLFEDALYWAEKCLFTAPDTISAVLLAAQTALETNATEIAVDSLERLLDITNENRNIVVALAQLYMKVGRVDEATALFNKSDMAAPLGIAAKSAA